MLRDDQTDQKDEAADDVECCFLWTERLYSFLGAGFGYGIQIGF